ncbi:hypothetical protein GPECTOR_56g365 [Gonium pectorale]|uniref:Uncharacterized protein n=1 Tax=Gonium pectorale TaxID=33097 RepID=A0A150G5V9_GONPE|nr:hypothetical protein GPECTOR_56g365 [Gonium pectorale]|eukprot:KXZ45269.1 hypothetical protein GPECTOR_56g365 [Gonium pectorale]
MPPLPTLWDPAGAVDKLPQPFRMIDKILADIVEQVVDLIGKREQQRKLEDAARVSLTFAPHAVMEVPPQTTAFLPLGMAPGTPGSSHSDRTHASQVTALVPLPQDPDDASLPVRIYWAPNLCHLAVAYGSGALTLFGVSLPVPNVELQGAGAFVALTLSAFGDTSVRELLRIPKATVRAFCLGSDNVGRGHVVWQMQQRPDRNPHSDRHHKTARGAYVWWEHANRLLLLDLSAVEAAPPLPQQTHQTPRQNAAAAAAQALEAEASGGSAKTVATAGLKGASGKALAAAVDAAAAAAAAAAATAGSAPPPLVEPTAPPRLPQIAPQSRDWLLPHNVTASATTSDSKTLAWGLVDGSVVLWDDRSCCATNVLPRLRGPITALAWVNGIAHKLMCASEAGDIYVADIIKPEDSSQKPYEFPQPIHEIHFLPYETFALCVCRGHTSSDGELPGAAGAGGISLSGGAGGAAGAAALLGTPARRPRVFWYNVLEEKPVAELMGPQAGQGFGLVCCVPPPPAAAAPPAPPKPEGSEPKLPAASSGAKAALITALNAMGAAVSLGPTLVPVRLAVPPGAGPVTYPAISYKDTYLVIGGDVVDKVVHSRFAEDDDAVPQRVTLLYMYKLDALMRHLLPEDETTSRLGKVVLDRILADLEAPRANRRKGKRVTMDVEDPDAPKLPSSMRKPDPFDPAGSSGKPSARAANRHITFGNLDELFNDMDRSNKKPKEVKVFPKETKKGLKMAPVPNEVAMINRDRRGPDGKPRLAPIGLEKAKEEPPPFAERSQSPPWHHTNPLARIHPDWEEAPVLIRIMERIGSKGGGRKRRDKRLEQLTDELMGKFAKEAGAKPNLFVDLGDTKAELGGGGGSGKAR